MIIKKILALALFVSLIATSFAFTITGDSGNVQEYFSLDHSQVTITHSDNSSNITLNYEVNSNAYFQTFALSDCSGDFCTTIDLNDYKEGGNGSVSFPDSYEVILGSETKTIYLDLEKPDVININSSLNTSTKQVTLTFELRDNSNKFSKADLYIITDNVKEKVASVLNSTSYTYVISESKNYSFEFDVADEAQNSNQVTYDLEIGDIFPPSISTYRYIENSGSKSLEITFKDDTQLDSYKISQGSLELSEDLTGAEVSKTIPLPFSSGTITVTTTDKEGNVKTDEISLSGSISVTSFKKYNNEPKLVFNSDGTKCVLTNENGNSKSTNFEKSSSTFSLGISSYKYQEISVTFYCENSHYRKYFTETFYYDNSKPDEIYLNGTVEDDGDIKLTWTEAKDSHTEVEYTLYREGKKIYEGSKSKYTDSKAEWPETYEYVVRVTDKAGNYEESDDVKLQPKKVDVTLYTSNQKDSTSDKNSYDVTIYSEKEADVSIKVFSNNVETFSTQKVFNKDSEQFNLPLTSGVNRIEVTSKDDFGNEKKESFYITYNEPTLSAPSTPEPVVQEPVIAEPVVETPVVQETEAPVIEPESSFGMFAWFFIVLLITSLVVWYVLTHEDILKSKLKKKQHDYYRSRKQDVILGSSLKKVKQEREQRQKQRAEERRKTEAKKQREKSNYEKQKLKELSKKREVKIPMTTRMKSKRVSNRAKKEVEYNEVLDKVKEETHQKGFFEKVFGGFKQQEKKQDEFGDYLVSKQAEQSWDSTRSYRASHIEKLKKQEEERIAQIEKEKAEEKHRLDLEAAEKKKVADKEAAIKQKEEADLAKAMMKQSGEEYRAKRKKSGVDLDDYLSKKTKKKSWFFAEREVERDLRK